MDKKKLLQQLQKEQKDLGQKIMALSNSLYFNDSMPAKDLVREQRQAMDNYFEALEARILDLEYDIDMAKIFDEAYEACQPAEEKEEPMCANFIDRMCDELNERVDELLDVIRDRNHKVEIDPLKELEGKRIINTNPPHCHECENDGTGCVKIILPGNQHLCAK